MKIIKGDILGFISPKFRFSGLKNGFYPFLGVDLTHFGLKNDQKSQFLTIFDGIAIFDHFKPKMAQIDPKEGQKSIFKSGKLKYT